jgi:hypothetical protein
VLNKNHQNGKRLQRRASIALCYPVVNCYGWFPVSCFWLWILICLTAEFPVGVEWDSAKEQKKGKIARLAFGLWRPLHFGHDFADVN